LKKYTNVWKSILNKIYMGYGYDYGVWLQFQKYSSYIVQQNLYDKHLLLIKDKSYLRLDRISASNYPRDNFIRYRDRPEYGWNGHHWTSINDSITQSLFDITDMVYVYHNFAISKKKIKNFWLFLYYNINTAICRYVELIWPFVIL
jgi:hypothetical protein